MYVWKKQILTSIIIDDASKKNIRIYLFHPHFFLPCSIFCACILPVSFSFYFIVAVLMRKCWGQHSSTTSIFLYSHTECYLLLSRNEMILDYIGRRCACQKQTIIITNACAKIYFFTWHHIIKRPHKISI